MKYYKYIIAILALLIISLLFVFFYQLKLSYKTQPSPSNDSERPIVSQINEDDLNDKDLTTTNLRSSSTSKAFTGYLQSIIPVDETEIGGIKYHYRVAILNENESVTRLWVSDEEYQSILNQISSEQIQFGNKVVLTFEDETLIIKKIADVR